MVISKIYHKETEKLSNHFKVYFSHSRNKSGDKKCDQTTFTAVVIQSQLEFLSAIYILAHLLMFFSFFKFLELLEIFVIQLN